MWCGCHRPWTISSDSIFGETLWSLYWSSWATVAGTILFRSPIYLSNNNLTANQQKDLCFSRVSLVRRHWAWLWLIIELDCLTGDALDQLTLSIQSRSRGYKKPALATVFLLNNYNHILRQIRTPPLNAVFDDSTEMKFSKLVKKQIDSYQDSWKPCVENLMDVTYVRGGTIKNSMGSGERQLVKERFKVKRECGSIVFNKVAHMIALRTLIPSLKRFGVHRQLMLSLMLNCELKSFVMSRMFWCQCMVVSWTSKSSSFSIVNVH